MRHHWLDLREPSAVALADVTGLTCERLSSDVRNDSASRPGGRTPASGL